MAKIQSESIVITFSKLVRDNDSNSTLITTDDIKQGLEAVAQELVGDSVIVEVFKE